MSDRPSPSDRFEALLCDLRSDNPNRRIPAVRLARDQRLQDPAHVGAIVALWQQAENEHVRAGAGEVLVAVAPQLMAPHLSAVIDSLADPSQFARLAAVGVLQKMQGHGLLPQEVLHEHDARLIRALQADHCDDAVRDLVANEIMTVAFAPGGLGADSAGHSFHAAAGSGASWGGGESCGGCGAGGGGESPKEQLRAVLGPAVPDSLLLRLLEESHNDANFAANLHMSRLFGEEAPGAVIGAQLGADGGSSMLGMDGVVHLDHRPLASSTAVAEGQLDGTLPQHPLAVRVASERSGTVAASHSGVAQGQLDGTLPHDAALAVRVVDARAPR